jgi:tetratricopeptide (TPR) repeat protein
LNEKELRSATLQHDSREKRALAFLQQNDLASARSLYAGIVADNPNDSHAQYMLGIVHARQGNLHEAEQHLSEAVGIDPNLAEGWLRLGQVYERQGRYPEAEASLQRSLALKPALLEPRELLGRVYIRLGRIDDAIEQCRMAVAQMPASLPALDGLIRAYRLAGRQTEAYQACTQALSVAPGNARVLVCMGQICRARGDIEAALRYFREALQHAPADGPAIYGGTEALERIGQPEQALALLQPLLSRLASDPELLILYTRIGARLQLDDAIDERLEQALRNPALDARARERMHFLLGDLRDRQARYKEAFAHYHAGNQAVWQRLDDSKYHDEIDAIIAGFEALGGALQPNPEPQAITPIFIVGMPRSGTSLVEQILASHPQVYGAGELNVLSDIAAELGYASPAFKPDAATLAVVARRNIDALKELAGGALFVTDKLPGNFLFIGLIALMFPDARIIHTRRDPLDTCLSCYFQYFLGAHKYSYDLGQLGRYYRQYEKLMAYWRQRGIAFLDVQYEHLVADLEGVSRQMTAYCGLDWNEACLNYHQSGRVIATASYHQVNQPIYTASIGRWRHYEKFLAPLQEGLAHLP